MHNIKFYPIIIFKIFLDDKDPPGFGHWAIVDCHPEATTFCGDTYHEILRHPAIVPDGTMCPWTKMAEPWEFCTGPMVITGCDPYEDDETLVFTCN